MRPQLTGPPARAPVEETASRQERADVTRGRWAGKPNRRDGGRAPSRPGRGGESASRNRNPASPPCGVRTRAAGRTAEPTAAPWTRPPAQGRAEYTRTPHSPTCTAARHSHGPRALHALSLPPRPRPPSPNARACRQSIAAVVGRPHISICVQGSPRQAGSARQARTRRHRLSPGPTVTATAASWLGLTPAALSAASTVTSMAAACASRARLGTTPPAARGQAATADVPGCCRQAWAGRCGQRSCCRKEGPGRCRCGRAADVRRAGRVNNPGRADTCPDTGNGIDQQLVRVLPPT
jgi:hypothetical protein